MTTAEKALAPSATTTIHFVPHTHWDREWYEPFQVFRMRLVELVDHVLDHLEREPAFRFTLDGQLATVDDYLEIRPEQEERLRRFVRDGRLAIGPWQILMDEFLVSGETIVRNLQHGWQRAQDFGQPMRVGYLPDMFGHIAQMPQILRRAGIDSAVVWRGVPAAVDGNRFIWRAPDGSEVSAEYLVGGYGNAAYLLEVPGSAETKVRAYRDTMEPWYGRESLLAMYGTDHMAPLPEMVALLESINDSQADVHVTIETLADYIASSHADRAKAPTAPTATIDGELRSAARANMLMGVTSSHVDIRAAAARAERWLSRYAEPLTALHGGDWPSRLLEVAWHRVIDCSAHDSICGCSVDPVAAQVLVRLGEAEQIARELTARTGVRLARRVPRGSWLWLNPSPTQRRGLVELDVLVADDSPAVALQLADGSLVATQEIERNVPLLLETQIAASEIATFLHRRMHGRELFGKQLNAATVADGVVTLQLDVEADPEWLDVDQLRSEIETTVMTRPDATWPVRLVSAARRRVRAMVDAPALGWTSARPIGGSDGRIDDAVSAGDDTLDNGLVSVRVAADGTLTIERNGVMVSGVGRLVDGGDAGDSYNYGPPAFDAFVDTPTSASATVLARGPVYGELLVRRTYEWPVRLSADRRARGSDTATTDVDMRVELRAREPFVRISLEFDNQSEDHRVRFHVPLPEATEHSSAEGQYAVVKRSLPPEGGHGEVALPTFPAYGWVSAGGVTALLDYVTEYEVVDGNELALTCLRSIGMISRNDNPYREDPAGPERPMPAAQLRGRRRMTFGLLVHPGEWDEAGVVEAAEQYTHEFVVARGGAATGESSETTGEGVSVTGDGVVLTALRRVSDWIELRIVSESTKPTSAVAGGGITEAREVGLLGQILGDMEINDGQIELPVDPWQIRTLQIRQ